MGACCISCKKCFVEIITVPQLTLFFQILGRLAVLCIRRFVLSRKLLEHWLRVLHIRKINWLVKMVVCNWPLVCTVWSWLRVWYSNKRTWGRFFLYDILIFIWYILWVNSSNCPVIMAFQLVLHPPHWWPRGVHILSLKWHTHAVFILLDLVEGRTVFILRLVLILNEFAVSVKMAQHFRLLVNRHWL